MKSEIMMWKYDAHIITFNIVVNLKMAIETPVARQVPYGEPDYTDPRQTSWLTCR